MKIYTKKGDKGETSLLGGKKVSKEDLQIKAYGTVDELNSHIALLRDKTHNAEIKKTLILIQNQLFIIGSNLATESNVHIKGVPCLEESSVNYLEEEIDTMNNKLPSLTSFILPGGHEIVSVCHIARCVCRRAERNIVSLFKRDNNHLLSIKYLNRLSDYLFVLARCLSKELGIQEVLWPLEK